MSSQPAMRGYLLAVSAARLLTVKSRAGLKTSIMQQEGLSQLVGES